MSGRIATAIRHELQTWIAPEVKDDRAKTVLAMIDSLLLDLALREDKLPARVAAQLTEHQRIVETLAQLNSHAPPLPQTSVVLTTRTAPILAPAPPGAEETVGTALEKEIARSIAAFRDLPQASRVATSQVLRQALIAEQTRWAGVLKDKQEAAQVKGFRADDDRIMEPDRLTRYLRTRMNATVNVEGVTKMFGGYSKETFIVRLSDGGRPIQSIVIRKDVDGGPVESRAIDEFPLLQALRELGIPVAKPLWAEIDASIFGRQFVVVECVPGSVGMDLNMSVKAQNPEVYGKLLARVLAQIHRIDLASFPLVPPGTAEIPLRVHVERVIDGFEGQWRRRRLQPSATFTAAFAWMRANIPTTTTRATLVHGDASLRNMLVHDNQITAMIDWELWHVGDPMEDLAYCRQDTDRVMPWDDFLKEYYLHGGVEYDERAARYYEMWMQLRNGSMSANLMHDFERRIEPDDIRAPYSYGQHYPTFVQYVADRLMAFDEFAGSQASGR